MHDDPMPPYSSPRRKRRIRVSPLVALYVLASALAILTALAAGSPTGGPSARPSVAASP
jgi:hypothetical protein